MLTRRLNRVDFPAFGGPSITTDAPDWNILVSSKQRIQSFSFLDTLKIVSPDCFKRFGCRSSSDISRLNSRLATIDIREDLMECISFDRPPLRFLTPAFTPVNDREWIIEATDSASDRSSLPFKKAVFVNSPASASLEPASTERSIILEMILGFPWHDISTKFSPVYEFGPT